MTCLELRAFDNKTVNISFSDGEVVTARLTCLDDSCDEVLVDILITNLPGRYREPHLCSYSVAATEIDSVTEIMGSEVGEVVPMELLPDVVLAVAEEASKVIPIDGYKVAA
ncbi:MAG TPA: hypothetical protein VGG85_02845 [Terracidiphilus sp.]|jgi:small nuclear ribonucleoprotein (snRNP)-like protein